MLLPLAQDGQTITGIDLARRVLGIPEERVGRLRDQSREQEFVVQTHPASAVEMRQWLAGNEFETVFVWGEHANGIPYADELGRAGHLLGTQEGLRLPNKPDACDGLVPRMIRTAVG